MAALVYGPPGSGKTSLAANIDDVLFMIDDKEDGLSTLKSGGLVPADVPCLPPAAKWEDAMEMLSQLVGSPYKALAIDTLGGFERLCHEYLVRTKYDGEWGEKGFASYQRGYDAALPEWRLFLNALDRLRNDGKSIMCLMHSVIRPYKNPEGDDYDRHFPDMHHKTWGVTHRWADMVLFLNYYVAVDKASGRAKGRGGQERYLYTEYHAAYEAKNRLSLPSEINAGSNGAEAWTNLRTAIKEARS